MAKAHNYLGWGLLAALLAFLYWLLKGGGQAFLTNAAPVLAPLPIPPDPITGCPQWDSTIPASFPSAQSAVVPIGSVTEGATAYPANPKIASCPQGYALWKDRATGAYSCLFTSVST